MNGDDKSFARMFSASRDNERPIDAVTQKSIEDWATVGEPQHSKCVAALVRALLCSDQNLVRAWCRQWREGIEIGSDYPRFHHDTGMQVRNLLRGTMSDDELPPNGSDAEGRGHPGHWDDYYMGALYEAICQIATAPKAEPEKPVEPPAPRFEHPPVIVQPYSLCGYAVQATHLIRLVRRGLWPFRREVLQQCYVILDGDQYTQARREWRDVEIVVE